MFIFQNQKVNILTYMTSFDCLERQSSPECWLLILTTTNSVWLELSWTGWIPLCQRTATENWKKLRSRKLSLSVDTLIGLSPKSSDKLKTKRLRNPQMCKHTNTHNHTRTHGAQTNTNTPTHTRTQTYKPTGPQNTRLQPHELITPQSNNHINTQTQ